MRLQVSGLKISYTYLLSLLLLLVIIFQVAVVDATSNSGAKILGDINGSQGVPDGRIDFEDITRFVELYQTQIYQPLIDLNRDFCVDSIDIVYLVDAYNNFYSNAFTRVALPFTISVSGSNFIAKNGAGATILTNGDFSALLNALNAQLVSGDTVTLADGIYLAKSTATITKTNIVVTGSSGTVVRHAVGLGDYPMLVINGSGNTVQGITFDDAYFCVSGTWADYYHNKNIGTNGCVTVQGTDNTLTACKLIRASRYGLLLGQSTRGTITYCEVTEAQYCISGVSGGGNAYWAVDGLIAHNTLSGFRLCGIKLKSFDGVVVEDNDIDCRSYMPSQSNNPLGVHFSGDSPNLDVNVRNNDFLGGSTTSSYEFGVHTDDLPLYALPNTIQTGNRITDNRFNGLHYGIYIQMDNFYVSGNTMTNVDTPYTNLGNNNKVN